MQRIGVLREDPHYIGAAVLALLAPLCDAGSNVLRVAHAAVTDAINSESTGAVVGHVAQVRDAALDLFKTAGVNLQDESIGARYLVRTMWHIILMQR